MYPYFRFVDDTFFQVIATIYHICAQLGIQSTSSTDCWIILSTSRFSSFLISCPEQNKRMFLAEKPRLTSGKIVVKLAYLPISAHNYFSPNSPFSEFCAIKVHAMMFQNNQEFQAIGYNSF